MDWNWLLSLVYGILSGFTTFLPVSESAHQGLFLQLFGIDSNGMVYRLAACLGALSCILISCRPTISKFRREQRIASIPAKRRKRQPDITAIHQVRLLRIAGIPMLLACVGGWFLHSFECTLWILSIAAVMNGVILYLPVFFRRGNKNARSLTYLDGLLIGLGSGLWFVPGISGIGAGISAATLCGSSRQTALEMGLLLSIPALLLLSILSALSILTAGAAGLSFAVFLNCLLIAIGAAFGAWVGILSMRFLSVNIGYSGFAFYSWGLALLMFILYLSI